MEYCTVCGKPIAVGDFPCVVTERPHQRGNGGIVTDEIPGGVIIENLGPAPIRVDSHAERLAIAKRQGLREPVKSDLPDSKHVVSWDTMDAKTLENATALVSRANALIEEADDAIATNERERVHYKPIDMVATLPVNPMEGL